MVMIQDLFETVGPAIDGIKFVGGSPHVLTRSSAVELVEISHTRFVYVCESGLLQHALAQVRGLPDTYTESKGVRVGDPHCQC
jgi:phosphosulfolactate synthase (CoM biosynthesis protein A)